MIEEGKYLHLWLKYFAVINILLKNTENKSQILQLYKHEFEHSASKQKTNFTFNIDLINGRAVKIVSTTSIARDLWQVLDNNQTTRIWMKDHKVRISLGKSFELQLEKIIEE